MKKQTNKQTNKQTIKQSNRDSYIQRKTKTEAYLCKEIRNRNR